MKDAQKPDHVSLTTLTGWLREGRFVIPDFQREFEWTPWDVRELMRSIFLDYYIGSLLLWRATGVHFDALACEPIYGHSGNGHPEHIVLDGQQRLTAIYYAFFAPDNNLPHRENRYLYFIHVDRFMAGAYDEAFSYDWTQRGPKLLGDRDLQYETHTFPLSVIGQGGFELPIWLLDYKKHWRNQVEEAQARGAEDAAEAALRCADDAHAFSEHIKGIVEQYQVAYVELDRDLELDKVCDIFTQINSRGVRLDVFDLVNALLKPKGLQLKQMWREAAPRLEFVEAERMDVYILQVMSILQQTYCSPKYLYYLLPGQEKSVREADGSLRKEVLVRNVAEFELLWKAAVDALVNAVKLLRHPQEFGVISARYLPYVSILPAFAALQAKAAGLPASRQLDAQRKIRHWYWASVFTNRYSGSVESTSARDYQDVRRWFGDDAGEPALIAEFQERFRSLDLRKEVRRGTSLYNGVFDLLVIRGARDWITGNVPAYDDLDDHHIVPKEWGRRQESVGGLIDSVLNRTPLTSGTNRRIIGDRLPNSYLPELIVANGLDTVRSTLASHFISPAALDILLRDPFTADDFTGFLDERQRTLQEAIETLLVKERLDLTPRLRELDEQVEEVELGIRRFIDETLGGDPTRLPSHVLHEVGERLRAAARKNPALDAERYQTLAGKLEYSDLRELQDTITNKALWPLFASRFTNKEILTVRFDQLAGLRNGLRHSRSVDEITRKEGEAAVLWFAHCMAKPAAAVPA